jgi:hypothetical protein
VSYPINKFFAVSVDGKLFEATGSTPVAACLAEILVDEGRPTGNQIGKGSGRMLGVRVAGFKRYIPERYPASDPRTEEVLDMERVHQTWIDEACTQAIVALFLDRETALKCLAAGKLATLDPRWQSNTRQVVQAIEAHPCFYVPLNSRFRRLAA